MLPTCTSYFTFSENLLSVRFSTTRLLYNKQSNNMIMKLNHFTFHMLLTMNLLSTSCCTHTASTWLSRSVGLKYPGPSPSPSTATTESCTLSTGSSELKSSSFRGYRVNSPKGVSIPPLTKTYWYRTYSIKVHT